MTQEEKNATVEHAVAQVTGEQSVRNTPKQDVGAVYRIDAAGNFVPMTDAEAQAYSAEIIARAEAEKQQKLDELAWHQFVSAMDPCGNLLSDPVLFSKCKSIAAKSATRQMEWDLLWGRYNSPSAQIERAKGTSQNIRRSAGLV